MSAVTVKFEVPATDELSVIVFARMPLRLAIVGLNPLRSSVPAVVVRVFVTAPSAKLFPSFSVPAVIVVTPVCEFVPLSVSVPAAPFLVMAMVATPPF